jgi:hypothetical protein
MTRNSSPGHQRKMYHSQMIIPNCQRRSEAVLAKKRFKTGAGFAVTVTINLLSILPTKI